MAPRNPDESPEEDGQDKALQPAVDVLPGEKDAPAAPGQQSAPASEAPKDGKHDAEPELDRIEIYLKGPTVFTA